MGRISSFNIRKFVSEEISVAADFLFPTLQSSPAVVTTWTSQFSHTYNIYTLFLKMLDPFPKFYKKEPRCSL